MSRRTVLGGAIVALMTCLIAGCSSDDTIEATRETTATTAAPTTAVPASPATDDDAFCAMVAEFRASNQSLTTEFSSGDPTQIEDTVRRMRLQADTLRDAAPDAVAADLNAVVDYLNRFGEVMAKYAYDVDAIDADAAATAEFDALTTPASTLAFQHLTAYAKNICGITE